MRKISFTFVLILIIIQGSIFSQVSQEWVARYNGPLNNSDRPTSIAVDRFGNVFVAGAYAGIGTNSDFLTIKYSSQGIQQWLATYNGPGSGNDGANSIVVDRIGNVYVTGNSFGNTSQDDFTTIKYNSAGVRLWVVRYNGLGGYIDIPQAITIDSIGNIYVTGYAYRVSTSNDYATIKYNSDGIQQWIAIYSGPVNKNDIPHSIAVDQSGNVYVTGESWGNETGPDYATIKYNSSGVQQWASRYNGSGLSYDKAYSIAVDNSGNVFVTGSENDPLSDFITIKYDSSGVQQWVARYFGTGNGIDVAKSLAVDKSGNVIVTGFSQGSGTNFDYATIKYNTDGIEQWVKRYNGAQSSDDKACALVLDDSCNVYITGASQGNGAWFDFVTIKYSSTGNEMWVQRYNGPGNNDDYAVAITIDSNRNVFITGGSTGIGTSYDFATIKYSSLSGIRYISKVIPFKYSLSQNYPNPFNPETRIRYSLPRSSFVDLVVYDALGREVRTIVNNEKQEPGTYEAVFDASLIPSGVYYYRLTAEGFSETRKMVVLK